MKTCKRVLISTLFVLAFSASFSAMAADGAELYKAKGCTACHGADAKSAIMPAYPNLAGQNADYLLAQMKDIKSGARSNGQTAAMKGIIAAVSDEEMNTLAHYLAGLPAK